MHGPRPSHLPLVALAALAAGVSAPQPTSAAQLEAVPPSGPVTGEIVGKVKLLGPPPRRVAIVAHHHPEVCGAGQPMMSEGLVVAPDGGVSNVVLVVHGAAEGAPVPPQNARLEQHNCTFAPHVQTVTAGSVLEIVNGDPVLHNVHAYLRGRTLFNLAMPVKGLRVKRTLREPGAVAIRCDSGHTWMRAYIVVVPHAHHATSGADGSFSLAGVPAGTYTVTAWHEELGTLEKSVTITPGQPARIDFSYESRPATAGAADREVQAAAEFTNVFAAKLGQIEESLRGELGKTQSDIKALHESVQWERRARIAQEARPLFTKHCATCHGTAGDGTGVSARFLDVPPRDFTRGDYKFRMTPSGTPAREDDLYRTITLGIPGTPMPPWRRTLTDAQRRRLAQYIMSLSSQFDVLPTEPPITIPEEPPADAASVERGRAIFQQMQCFLCHGAGGRGDGPSGTTLKDDWGNPIRAWDFTRGYFKGGKGGAVIFRAISTGLSGSPMPSYADMLEPAKRWDLVHYIQSLARKRTVLDYFFGDAAGRMTLP